MQHFSSSHIKNSRFNPVFVTILLETKSNESLNEFSTNEGLTDRGYLSDSELYQQPPTTEHLNNESNVNLIQLLNIFV